MGEKFGIWDRWDLLGMVGMVDGGLLVWPRSSCMVWAQATSPQRSILCDHMVLGVLGPWGPLTSGVLFLNNSVEGIGCQFLVQSGPDWQRLVQGSNAGICWSSCKRQLIRSFSDCGNDPPELSAGNSSVINLRP